MGLRVLLVLALLATAPVASAADVSTSGDEGPFLGERYRYSQMSVPWRVLYDVVGVPANVPRWSASDWAQFGLYSTTVVALMLPLDPSPDVRIDRYITDHVTGKIPTVWTGPMQAVLWGSLAVGGLGTWWWADHTGRSNLAQGMSLVGEAVAATQVYHLSFKLVLGRDGPTDGNGLGEFLGPANAIKVYPAGTPSGHAATLYSVMGAGFAYFEPPWWLQATGHVLVGTVVAFHVIDHRHYASESLWGSAMGWYMGRWVVHHRASWRFRDGPPGADEDARATVVPFLAVGGGGLALTGRF